MKDPSGNEIPKEVEYSMQMRCYVLSNKVDKALWRISKAAASNVTKAEMKEAINDAAKLLIEVRRELAGQ